jgi:hypothetical protein
VAELEARVAELEDDLDAAAELAEKEGMRTLAAKWRKGTP